jgi:pimeloyl-ACP methyl ester carboxylesterase
MSAPVVLIPGAGGQAWLWHLVEADLRQRGYDAFAVDLPAADESKEPARLRRRRRQRPRRPGERRPDAGHDRAYSLGAFTAPLVWQRVPAGRSSS